MPDSPQEQPKMIKYDDIGVKLLEEKDRSINELRETVEVII